MRRFTFGNMYRAPLIFSVAGAASAALCLDIMYCDAASAFIKTLARRVARVFSPALLHTYIPPIVIELRG